MQFTAQVKLFVEKTGCDAAILSAPFPLHGTEAAQLQDVALTSGSSIHLSFSCDELLVSLLCRAADRDCRFNNILSLLLLMLQCLLLSGDRSTHWMKQLIRARDGCAE